jgi:tRNA(His) guanylyltransferase
MNKDSLGDRMKKYEDAYRISLPIRMPVIIRVDGKAFHSYTKKCKKPIDEKLVQVMNDTAINLCQNIQGAKLAYVQSDEISILVNNFTSLDSQSWFDNNLQKMVSISAAIASTTFTANSWKIWFPKEGAERGKDSLDYIKSALFDSRAFVLPKEEVCNYFIWRQQDATRNSVQMLARSLYSHKECTDKNNSELQEMCFRKGFNWNDCPTSQKRGRCITKQVELKKVQILSPKAHSKNLPSEIERRVWKVDNEIPVFSQNRNYIDQYLVKPVELTEKYFEHLNDE